VISAPATYYAVPDPTNPSAMTYWRRDRRGRLAPWPPRARYGPTLTPADIPDHLAGQDRREWISDWARAHLWPWHEAVHAAIDADPDGCAARFAAMAARCCRCGRALTDPESKTYGIGPECRRDVPAELLTALAGAVARAHASAATTPEETHRD